MNTILGIVLITYFVVKIIKTIRFINFSTDSIKSNLEDLTLHVVNKKGNSLDVIYNKDSETFDIKFNNE